MMTKMKIPAELVKLGLRIASDDISGETKLVLSAMTALKEHLKEWECPENDSIRKALQDTILTFKEICKEFEEGGEGLDTAFTNIFNSLKLLPSDATTKTTVDWLIQVIDEFINLKIIDCDKFMQEHGLNMIKEGDVILIYGYSMVLENILLRLNPEKDITLIIVNDNRKEHCQNLSLKLSKKGLQVIYTLLEGVPYLMPKVTKVFVGAVTMYSNGTLLGIAGTAIVATHAKTFRRPFYVFCQTFKFSENTQIDSLICNQMVTGITKQQKMSNHFISLRYDLTPMKFISLVISEVGMMPPSSVSVILREFKKYDSSKIKYPEEETE